MNESGERLSAALGPVIRRIRAERALASLPYAFGAASGALAVGLVARFGFGVAATWFFVVAGLGAAIVVVAAVLRGVSLDLAASRVDDAHGYDDRLRTAVDLVRRGDPGDFERAAIADALRRPVDPARAVRFGRPKRAVPLGAGALALGLLLGLPRPNGSSPGMARATAVASRPVLDEETLEATRADLDDLRRRARGRSVETDLRALDAVLDAMTRGTIDREEAFRRLDEIGRRVALAPRESDRTEALEHVARSLGERSERLDALVAAMREADAAAAARAMAGLANDLRAGALDRGEVDRMREAFERLAEAARERSERSEELLRRREELRRELEREREPSLLERRRRELERLERELEELERQERELERLERELDEAAEDLNRSDARGAAEDMDQAFEDLNRMAREQMDERDRQELEQQLEQLREAMRRQQPSRGGASENQGGGGASGAMRRFRLRAGGSGGEGSVRIVGPRGQGSEGESGGPGGSGESQAPGGEGQSPGEGGESQGSGGEGQGRGPSSSGGSGGETVLQIGGGGEGADAILELPNGARPGGSGGTGRGRESAGAGRDHDPTSLESPTDLDSEGALTRVEGEHGEGATRSQVLRGAASAGFASRGYRDVHSDYSDHAEEILAREDVPPGYRYYVRRYFQLIRPREEPSP